MKRKKPSFNETYYGFRTFSHLLEDAQRRGIVVLRRDQRSGSYIVEDLGTAKPASTGQRGDAGPGAAPRAPERAGVAGATAGRATRRRAQGCGGTRTAGGRRRRRGRGRGCGRGPGRCPGRIPTPLHRRPSTTTTTRGTTTTRAGDSDEAGWAKLRSTSGPRVRCRCDRARASRRDGRPGVGINHGKADVLALLVDPPRPASNPARPAAAPDKPEPGGEEDLRLDRLRAVAGSRPSSPGRRERSRS